MSMHHKSSPLYHIMRKPDIWFISSRYRSELATLRAFAHHVTGMSSAGCCHDLEKGRLRCESNSITSKAFKSIGRGVLEAHYPIKLQLKLNQKIFLSHNPLVFNKN